MVRKWCLKEELDKRRGVTNRNRGKDFQKEEKRTRKDLSKEKKIIISTTYFWGVYLFQLLFLFYT